MRIWEVDENKAVSSNLVREQDFIMLVRRLHRSGIVYQLINIPLSQIEGRGPLEEVQEHLQAFATATVASYIEMSNGDVFLLWPETSAPPDISEQVTRIVFPEGLPAKGNKNFLLAFRLPDTYAALRERCQHYVEISRDASLTSAENTPAQILQSEAARGPLTAWSADMIGKLIQDIDLHRYVKTQTVYERGFGGSWRALFEEVYVGFDELRQAHFPKMDFDASDHLFMTLCRELDQRLLADLALRADTFQNLSLNLTLSSLTGAAFASFVRALPRSRRSSIVCELNCGDLFQDFTSTLNILSLLRQEGLRMAIDGVTPDMLIFLNPGKLDADYVKLNVSKTHYAPLDDPAVRSALMAIPREKLIFYRCDHEQALVFGQSIGVTKFQGWYVDEVAGAKI